MLKKILRIIEVKRDQKLREKIFENLVKSRKDSTLFREIEVEQMFRYIKTGVLPKHQQGSLSE